MYWNKLSVQEIKNKIITSLNKNVNYEKNVVFGIPGTYLDEKIFYKDATFLNEAPFLQTLIANPNHIGCHTLNNINTEPYFSGTQEIEKEVIKICSEEIFKSDKDEIDGYIASGGTEANIQAIWVYRNYFIEEYGISPNEITVVYSEDSHYSMLKACNMLFLNPCDLEVNEDTRQINLLSLKQKVNSSIKNGTKAFIVVQNMATTLFGSIDDIDTITDFFDNKSLIYKLHIDAAFGGFVIPFKEEKDNYSFKNLKISSFTLDGHKMLQTPYGTGIFLIRKNMLKYVKNNNAKYVKGNDFTICGSRSGANAISIWMTLVAHGSKGWKSNILELLKRTDHICKNLDHLGVNYYRNKLVNIVTIKATSISSKLAKKYGLVPDNNDGEVSWWKIVVMKHVTYSLIDKFLDEYRIEISKKNELKSFLLE
jgi:tyrosine decarboxylase / aspartate 1-decarboxylase